ncbi:uncharacterized protein LOC123696816 [Colias croceus]|uniref:uncharacterized protein LOC123696816 n=1 Tax=Colias crocea TaxID=72248 RepID=UPI001E27C4B9|nr:uncharacterized protein LOC123696816 [Colias croceus]
MELGEQKPSQLLRRMKELAKDKIPDDTLRILWQGHLPNAVRAVLAVSDTKSLDSLAAIADNVLESTQSVSSVNEVTQKQHQPSTSATNKDTELIMAEIAKLTFKVANLERSRPARRWNYRGRSRSQSRNRAHSASRRSPNSPGWLCFYHHRFRDNARNCKEPCAWKVKEN